MIRIILLAAILASCGGHGQEGQKGTTVIDQPSAEIPTDKEK